MLDEDAAVLGFLARNFFAFPARLGKPDGDGLLAARDFLAATT